MTLLRYTWNDTTERVDVQESWDIELYNSTIHVENGYARTDDDVELMALLLRGFEVVDDLQEQPDENTPQDEPEGEPEDEPEGSGDVEVEEGENPPEPKPKPAKASKGRKK